MKKEELKKLIDTAAGRIPADTVIKNCQVVNVFSGKIQKGDIEMCIRDSIRTARIVLWISAVQIQG